MMASEHMLIAICGLMALCMTLAALLKGWQGWLDLKQQEIARGSRDDGTTPAGARIELAAMRERIRRLEAIAAGVDI